MPEPTPNDPSEIGRPRPVLTYLLLCDGAAQFGGKHYFIGVFDRIFANQFPCTHPEMTIAFELIGAPDDQARVEFQIDDPNGGHLVPPHAMDVSFTPFGTAFHKVTLRGLPIPNRGIYEVRITWNGATLGTRTLYVDALRT